MDNTKCKHEEETIILDIADGYRLDFSFHKCDFCGRGTINDSQGFEIDKLTKKEIDDISAFVNILASIKKRVRI
jgi:hypothetical protein